jgi:pimeloyl-ACP methyl ester carboxylesterase
MTHWILLRGLTRDSRHWGRFPGVFCARLPDANVVALDLPGNGVLNMQRSPATVAEMTAFCRAELPRRGAHPPYHLLAMSLGAMVAVDWATVGAADVQACVLINTSLRPFSPFHRRLRPGTYATLLKLMLTGGTDLQWEETILRLTSTRVELRSEVMEQWAAFRSEHPVARANALRQLLAAARYRGGGHMPAARMLILASANDALVDSGCSQALAEAWKATIAVHPTAGHDIPLDDGPWVAEQVARWMSPGTDSGMATPPDPVSHPEATPSGEVIRRASSGEKAGRTGDQCDPAPLPLTGGEKNGSEE